MAHSCPLAIGVISTSTLVLDPTFNPSMVIGGPVSWQTPFICLLMNSGYLKPLLSTHHTVVPSLQSSAEGETPHMG